jgi:hypothetical protein
VRVEPTLFDAVELLVCSWHRSGIEASRETAQPKLAMTMKMRMMKRMMKMRMKKMRMRMRMKKMTKMKRMKRRMGRMIELAGVLLDLEQTRNNRLKIGYCPNKFIDDNITHLKRSIHQY